MAHSAERKYQQQTPFRLINGAQYDEPGILSLATVSPVPPKDEDQRIAELITTTAYGIDRKLGRDKVARKIWHTSYDEFLSHLTYLHRQESLLDKDDVVLYSLEHHEDTDLYFQRIAAMFMIGDVLDRTKKDPHFRGVREDVYAFGAVVRNSMIPLMSTTEDGVRLDDFRSSQTFLDQHDLGTFLKVASKVDIHEEDGALKINNPITSFVGAVMHTGETIVARKSLKQGEDRKAVNALIPPIRAISHLREMTMAAIQDPTDPEHENLVNQVRQFLKDHQESPPRIHMAVLLLGRDIVGAYRKAYELQNGENGDIFKVLLEALKDNREEAPSRFLFIDEARSLVSDEQHISHEPKGIPEIRAVTPKILANFSKEQFSVDGKKIPDWGIFKEPTRVGVGLDKALPHEVSLELEYEIADVHYELGVKVNTKTGEVGWSVMEPIEADPELAKQIVHTLATVLEAIESSKGEVIDTGKTTSQGEVRSQVAERQNGHKRKRTVGEELRSNQETRLTVSEDTQKKNGRLEIKKELFFEPGSAGDLLRHLSTTDQQIVRSAIRRFNSDGAGTFEILHIWHEGRRMYELKSSQQGGGSGIRVLCAEVEDGVAGSRRFEIVRVEYRHHLKRKDWGGH